MDIIVGSKAAEQTTRVWLDNVEIDKSLVLALQTGENGCVITRHIDRNGCSESIRMNRGNVVIESEAPYRDQPLKTEGVVNWLPGQSKLIKTPQRVVDFIEAIDKVCIEHNMAISHEDGQGSFQIVPYNQTDVADLMSSQLFIPLDSSEISEP